MVEKKSNNNNKKLIKNKKKKLSRRKNKNILNGTWERKEAAYVYTKKKSVSKGRSEKKKSRKKGKARELVSGNLLYSLDGGDGESQEREENLIYHVTWRKSTSGARDCSRGRK